MVVLQPTSHFQFQTLKIVIVLTSTLQIPTAKSLEVSHFERHAWRRDFEYEPRSKNKSYFISGRSATCNAKSNCTQSCRPSCLLIWLPCSVTLASGARTCRLLLQKAFNRASIVVFGFPALLVLMIRKRSFVSVNCLRNKPWLFFFSLRSFIVILHQVFYTNTCIG